MITVGLFVPCYIDQCCPDVGWATIELLERFGCRVTYPTAQTCCGQPMANAGFVPEAQVLASRFVDIFCDREFQYVVAPSGSCVAMVRHQFPRILAPHSNVSDVVGKTYELCEFLVDILKVAAIRGSFPHRVGLHQSCHGVRELRLASSSERTDGAYDKVRALLQSLHGIEFVELKRPDECCGFGGTFAVDEDAISCQMGNDRLDDHVNAGVDVITSTDMSCLIHLQGLARQRSLPIEFLHVAQLLAGRSCGTR